MAILVTYGSKTVKTKDKDGAELVLHLVTTQTKQQFWSNEALRGGLIVDVTERKAGEKYKDKDGNEKTVLKDGLNFNYLIGTATDAREIAVAKLAVLECEL